MPFTDGLVLFLRYRTRILSPRDGGLSASNQFVQLLNCQRPSGAAAVPARLTVEMIHPFALLI